jgi:hypothetical protein
MQFQRECGRKERRCLQRVWCTMGVVKGVINSAGLGGCGQRELIGAGGTAILKVGARERRRHSAARPTLTNVGNRNPHLGTEPASPRSGTARFSNVAACRAAGGEGQPGRRETGPTDGLCWAREGERGDAALEPAVAWFSPLHGYKQKLRRRHHRRRRRRHVPPGVAWPRAGMLLRRHHVVTPPLLIRQEPATHPANTRCSHRRRVDTCVTCRW